MCIEDVLSIEVAAKTFLSREEAIALEGLGWFTDSYGRVMRSLESVVDQMSRDCASSDFVYPILAARQAVMTALVQGEDIHGSGFPSRLDCSSMTGFKGEHGGPWSTANSYTILPPGTAGKKLQKHTSKLHAVQAHFLSSINVGVVCFNPGQHMCMHLHWL